MLHGVCVKSVCVKKRKWNGLFLPKTFLASKKVSVCGFLMSISCYFCFRIMVEINLVQEGICTYSSLKFSLMFSFFLVSSIKLNPLHCILIYSPPFFHFLLLLFYFLSISVVLASVVLPGIFTPYIASQEQKYLYRYVSLVCTNILSVCVHTYKYTCVCVSSYRI